MVQMLVWFLQDVLVLKLQVVVILVGINDIVGNIGLFMQVMIEDNLYVMVDLVCVYGIVVVLVLVLLVSEYLWMWGIMFVLKVCVLNYVLKCYVEVQQLVYLDYYMLMVNVVGGLDLQLVEDGVYFIVKGYLVMVLLVEDVIRCVMVLKQVQCCNVQYLVC